MTEIISNKLNPYVYPNLDIWHYEIPLYLFLGGLAGGLLILSSGMILFKKESIENKAVRWATLLSPVILSIGMLFLLLDLEFKIHFWRFYTAFIFTSPMSWGAWMLLIFYPFSVMQALIVFKDYINFYPFILKTIKITEPHLQKIAVVNVHIGTGIGVYTGVLLSTFYARPLWNSSVLGFLFLLSGISTAAAVMLIICNSGDKRTFLKVDMYLISLEGFAATLFIIGGVTSAGAFHDAMVYLISGTYAAWFWVLFILCGLIIPLLLETLEVLNKVRYSPLVPLLVIIGSLSLRFIIVNAGQSFSTFY
ncbi:MAG: polysulfide reductase NrfD [Deltaproteobacteria bacterium]|nr:polysulfide reductase NrfD [Deltaproteobacteria bacterium]